MLTPFPCQCLSASAGAADPVTCIAALHEVGKLQVCHSTQEDILHLPWSGLPRDDMSKVYQQLGSLTALRHLCAMDLPKPEARDCRALQRLQQLTTLVIPLRVCLPCLLQHQAEIWCCLTCGLRPSKVG